MKALPWFGLGALAMLATGLGSACGSDEIGGTGGVIEPGVGGSGTGGRAGSGGGFGTGGVNNVSAPELGTTCTSDTDCTGGLKCLAADGTALLMGGPAKGLCTVDCLQAEGTTGACAMLNGACFYDVCFPRCTVGAPPNQKCHQRHEMACVELAAGGGAGVCLPQCNADSECPEGKICDIGAALYGWPGLCRTESLGGLPTGSACNASLPPEQDPCNGWCAAISQSDLTAGMCANGCTVGSPPECGWNGPADGPANEGCLFFLETDNIGDAGLCGQLCDCDDDCLHPNAVCQAFGAFSPFPAFYGRPGYCSVSTMAMGTPCGAGGMGGTGGSGGSGGSGSGGLAGGGSGG
jgi:hypothetical protein